MNQEAAEAVEALARDRFEEKGYILLRIGKAPKRAILFRTDAPFKKIQEFLISPDGSKEKIELLGDGQQLIVDGIHPDTGKPYAWFGGKPTETKREDLPYIHEAEARQLAEDAVELLCREHGYQRAAANRAKANGADHGSGPEDWAALIGSILAGNALHDSLRDLGGKLVKSGMNKGAAVNLLRAEMDNSTAERDARWQERRDDIPRLVDGAEEPETAQLRYTDITRDPIPPREWAVPDRIPARNLSGEGAVGKSILLLQLCDVLIDKRMTARPDLTMSRRGGQ